MYAKSLRLFHQLAYRWWESAGIASVACLASLQGKWTDAARLYAAAQALGEASSIVLPAADRAERDLQLARVRAAIGCRMFLAAWTEGQALGVDQAVQQALSVAEASAVSQSAIEAAVRVADAASLSPRQREIAQPVAKGWTNREIATALGASPRTADTHVGRLLRRLGLRSREQIAEWLARNPI